MTNSLMKPFIFPTLLPDDVFENFGKFFTGLDVYNPTNQSISLRKFPKGDVFFDKEGNRVIELALAGYNKDQLSISIDNGKMTISAEKCENDEDGEQRTLARRAFKQVFSSFGDGFDLEQSEVTFKDGLLRVIVPKVEKKEIIKKLVIK